MLVAGPNTREAEVAADEIDGEGCVDPADDRVVAPRGDRPGTPHETHGGPVSLDGRWSIG